MTAAPSAVSVPRSRFPVPVRLPLDAVANADLSPGEHLRERAASPVRVHRGAESGHGFLHALARLRLASNLEARGADAEHALPRVCQRDAAHHEVGAAGGRWGIAERLAHERVPHLALDDRDLPSATSADASLDALARDQRGGLSRVHGPTVRSLRPDGFEPASHALGALGALGVRVELNHSNAEVRSKYTRR